VALFDDPSGPVVEIGRSGRLYHASRATRSLLTAVELDLRLAEAFDRRSRVVSAARVVWRFDILEQRLDTLLGRIFA